ncbi:MAG: hypothetical protein HYY01_05075 [Chloroflexi bacterium]|nr:hypothetical protein [Chloroflexota bacterium]
MAATAGANGPFAPAVAKGLTMKEERDMKTILGLAGPTGVVKRRLFSLLVMLGFLALGLGLGSPARPALAAKASPDFALSANFGSSFVGHLVRGGLADCPGCATSIEPRYLLTSFGECFFDSNTLSVVSLNDFQGTVALQVVDLPPGVSSQTATTLNVPRRGAVTTPFKLLAATDAALGDATITVRATSGGITHTLALPVSVSDQLPFCDRPPSVRITSPASGATVSGTVIISADASDDAGVTEVRFHVDQTLVGTDSTAPYSIAWDTTTVGDGNHALSATAVDTAGQVTTAGFVNVTVGNSGIQPVTIEVRRAEYDSAKQELRVEATSSDGGASLTVFVTATRELIGTLANEGAGVFKGQFTWPINPQSITIKGSQGGSATATVTAK